MILDDILKRIHVGTIFADVDEGTGNGIVTQMSNSWVVIKWESLSGEWGTHVSEVVSSVLRGEWVIIDDWCSQIVIPNKNTHRRRYDDDAG